MNAIGEFDLELLEEYLDDALSPGQVEHVVQRLTDEPELALAMHELRAARVLRVATFRSQEPSNEDVQRVNARVVAMAHRLVRRHSSWWALKVGSAVAAALALFVAGWLLRPGSTPSGLQAKHSDSSNVPIHGALAINQSSPAINVALVDADGRLIPVQNFQKMDEAQEFARDLMQYETHRQEAQQGGAMLVSDRF